MMNLVKFDLYKKNINAQAELAVILERQRTAFLRDGPPDLEQRRARLAKLRAAILKHRSGLEEAVSADFGHRSRHETDIMEVLGILQAIDYLTRHLRTFMKLQRRHIDFIYRRGYAYVAYQPKGIIGIVAPWNYPLALTMIPLATALAAGNRAMIKPSELTPRTSERLHQMMSEIFAEEEVVTILGGAEVGAAFCGLAFDHLLFTGSTQVGRIVMKAASENLVPVTLELGGKSPAIIAQGHVNRQTVGNLVFGKLANAGQTCVAPDYALIHEGDVESFMVQYSAMVEKFYPQGPTSPDYSSIINERHYERLQSLIAEARQKGGRIIEVGVTPQAAKSRVRTLPPTLIVNATDDMKVMQEEIFGPILPVRSWKTMDEVIAFINARPRPLALYYLGPENADCRALLTHTTSGNVGINNTLMHVAQDDLPFGGVGPSGMGAYHSVEGFRSMSHAKGVFVQKRWNLPALLRPPFGRLANLSISSKLGKPS